MPGPETRIVALDDNGAVLLGHGRHRIRVVRVRQVFLCVQIRGQHKGLAIVATSRAESSTVVADGELGVGGEWSGEREIENRTESSLIQALRGRL